MGLQHRALQHVHCLCAAYPVAWVNKCVQPYVGNGSQALGGNVSYHVRHCGLVSTCHHARPCILRTNAKGQIPGLYRSFTNKLCKLWGAARPCIDGFADEAPCRQTVETALFAVAGARDKHKAQVARVLRGIKSCSHRLQQQIGAACACKPRHLVVHCWQAILCNAPPPHRHDVVILEQVGSLFSGGNFACWGCTGALRKGSIAPTLTRLQVVQDNACALHGGLQTVPMYSSPKRNTRFSTELAENLQNT